MKCNDVESELNKCIKTIKVPIVERIEYRIISSKNKYSTKEYESILRI